MADDSAVSVVFSADISQLTAAIAAAQAQLTGFSAAAGTLSKQAADAGRVANDTLRVGLESAGAGAANLKAAVANAEKGLSGFSSAAKGTASILEGTGVTASYLTREVRAMMDELSSGRMRQFDGTAVNLAAHLAQVAVAFAAANPFVAAAGAAAAVAGGWFAYLGVQALHAGQVAQQFRESLNLTGAISLTDQEISDLSETIRNLAGVTRDQAKEIVASFGAMANGSKAVFATIASDLGTLATSRDIKPEQMAKQLEDVFSEPYDAAGRLVKIVGDLTDAEREMLRVADQSGDPAKAQAAVAQVLEDHLGKLRGLREKDLELSLAQARAARDQMSAMGGEEAQASLSMLTAQISAWEKELAAIKAANDEAKKQAAILEGTQSSAEILRQRFDDVLKSISPWTSELQKAQDAIAALRAGLQASTGDAAALIRQFEGFKDKAYLDSDGKYRVGFGSDTTTSPSGQSSPVTSETTTTREDAERDLARRIVEFQTEAAREIGPAWARLTDEAKASLTSVIYNFGHLPGSVVSAAQTGGNAEIAGAIGSLSSNPGRRAQEAGNITGGGAAVTDPAKVREGTEAIAEQNDKILSITQAKAGGSEIEKAQLANLQAELAGRKDDIAATERLIEGTQRQLALTSSTAERAKLQKDLDQERVTLQDRQNSAKEAELRLSIGQAQGRGDAAGTRDAEVAMATFKQSLYAKDSAEYKEAEGEKEAAIRQFAATETQLAMDSAQKTVKSAESTAQALIKQYDTDAKAHAITEQEKLQKTREALNAEILQQEVALAAEANLENLRPKQLQDVLDQMLQLEQDYTQKVKQLQTEAADDATRSWQQAGQMIESAVNSQLKSVLSGGESVRSAMAKIAEDLIMDFAKIGETQLVTGIANQMASSFGNIGSALSSIAANALKAIAAGAGETAAGVSGFLAPILGPAAVPAGLSAGAAISAGARGIGMMDIGAYNIPTDQLAMVHKNELIMPAPQASAFRSMLESGGAGGGGQGGGDTHNWHISGAQSPIETARAVAKIWKDNFSLRPKY